MTTGNHLGDAFPRLERGLFRWLPELLTLPEAPRARLIDSARLLALPAGAALPDDAMGCVLGGRLGILKPLPAGRGHIVGLPGPGAVLGWMTDAEGAGYRIAALEPSEVALLDPGLFQGLLQDLPDLEQRLIGQVLDEAEAARDWLRLLALPRVAARLAGFLLMLRRQVPANSAPGMGDALEIPFRRAELAQYLGTRKETLSRAFHQLEEAAAIRLLGPAAVRIDRPAHLQELSGLEAEEPDSPARRR